MSDATHSGSQGRYDKQGYHVCRCGARTQYIMLTGGAEFYCPSCKMEGFYPGVRITPSADAEQGPDGAALLRAQMDQEKDKR